MIIYCINFNFNNNNNIMNSKYLNSNSSAPVNMNSSNTNSNNNNKITDINKKRKINEEEELNEDSLRVFDLTDDTPRGSHRSMNRNSFDSQSSDFQLNIRRSVSSYTSNLSVQELSNTDTNTRYISLVRLVQYIQASGIIV